MRCIIIGGGKVGYYLCKTLLENGHDVRLIEQDRNLCSRLADELDAPVIWGDGTSIEVLESADCHGVDALVAVTGKDENNLIACQLGKLYFKAKKVVARSNNPKNTEIMRKLGVDYPISSTGLITGIIEREVDSGGVHTLMHITDKGYIAELMIPPDAAICGKKIQQIQIPPECIIISIVRQGEMLVPRGNTVILPNDEVFAIASGNKVRRALVKALTTPHAG